MTPTTAPSTDETELAFKITDEEAKQIEVPEEFIDEIEEEIYNYLDNLEDEDAVVPLDETEHNVVKRSPHGSYHKGSYYKGYHGYNRGRTYHRPSYGSKRYYGGRHHGRHNSGLRKLVKGIVVASIIKGALLG